MTLRERRSSKINSLRSPQPSRSGGRLEARTPIDTPRYVVLDNNLVRPGGHSHAMARALLAAEAQLEVWAHQRTSIEHPRVKRVFSLSLADRRSAFPANDGGLAFKLRWLKRVVLSNLRYYRDLKSYDRGEAAIWIVNNGDLRTLLAILWFAARHRAQLKIAVYFHTPPSRTLRLVGKMASFLAVRNLRIALPHGGLAESYSSMVALPCSAVGYPLAPPDTESSCSAPERPPTAGVALGASRLDKGFDVLAGAIHLLRHELTSGSLRLLVQLSDQSDEGPVGTASRTIESLANSTPGLRLVRGVVPEASYQALLAAAHFLVLPYRAHSYRSRISAVLLEGLAAGKPAVVTGGTLLADTVREFGGGLVIDDGDSNSLAEGIRELIADYDRYADAACANRDRLLHECDPATFLKRIAELTRG